MDVTIYKKIVITNNCSSKQNINSVLVSKPGQIQLCLMFNYYFISENIPADYIEMATIVYDLLSISFHQYLFLIDIKYGYWVINVHLDDYHYLVFYVLDIGQVQFTYISQRAKTLSFSFRELMNIVLGPIPIPKPKHFFTLQRNY